MDSEWLKLQFDLQPEKTKSGLAKSMGLEPPAISKILAGDRQIKAHEYAAMRRYFNLPVDGEKSLHNNQADGYMLSSLVEKELHDNDHSSEWVIPASILSAHTEAGAEQVKIYKIRERIMEPEFKHGEHVLVDLSTTEPSPPGVFIVSDGFGYLIRHCEFVPSSDPPEIKISARDNGFQPQILEKNEFKIIGRVIGKMQWL